MEISVVLPAYNELKRRPPTLDKIEQYLKSNTSSWEIIVSDDGSSDRTVEKIAANFPQVRFLRAPENQGKGAASARIEEVRRLFPQCWFNEETCQGGLDALGWYHEKKDEVRNIGLGPEHDWASHGADAFGLMCVAHEIPKVKAKPKPKQAAKNYY